MGSYVELWKLAQLYYGCFGMSQDNQSTVPAMSDRRRWCDIGLLAIDSRMSDRCVSAERESLSEALCLCDMRAKLETQAGIREESR